MSDTTHTIPTSVMNARLLDSLERGETKTAEVAGSEVTRTGVREGSFSFQILPPEKVTDDQLDRSLDNRLQVICELQPESPGAKWVPLQTVPDGEYMTGSKYIVPFARVLTSKYMADIDELRTTKQDLRKVFTDNAIKDAQAAIDNHWISTVNSIVLDAPGAGQPNRVTGKIQWIDFADGLSRETFAEAKKMLPRGNKSGQFRLRNHICLMNDVTAQDWLKLDRNEVGGDLAETFFKDGLTTTPFMGVKAIFTIKSDIVPENYVYFFAAPEFLGKCFYLTDWTMFVKKEAFFVEMFSYWLGGFAFGNIAGMALARFNQS